MNIGVKWAMALALLSGAVHGQIPATNNTSDAYSNTGLGTGALSGVTPKDTGRWPSYGGDCNTATGNAALFQNYTGSNNSALGNQALYGVVGVGVTGSINTAIGANALAQDRTGGSNTAREVPAVAAVDAQQMTANLLGPAGGPGSVPGS